MSKCIGFIGAGNMASSLVGGLTAKGYEAKKIIVSDLNEDALASARQQLGVRTSRSNNEVASKSDILVLAVKPQVMKKVIADITDNIKTRRPLIISIAAGITTDNIINWIGGHYPVVRCMPNTPALVQTGATALFANAEVSDQQKTIAKKILDSVGLALWVETESDLDAVTALSGSGPAYYFLLMEAMINAGEKLGLDPILCRQLTLQTALGSAQMAITSDDSPAVLRQKVTSAGGTTEKALNSLEEAGFIKLFETALQGARDRSIELSKMVD
jgi:pyrroline-5-carboxylate reductase